MSVFPSEHWDNRSNGVRFLHKLAVRNIFAIACTLRTTKFVSFSILVCVNFLQGFLFVYDVLKKSDLINLMH